MPATRQQSDGHQSGRREFRHQACRVTLDEEYQFGEQKYWLQNPEISVQANDKVKVTCTYINNTMKDISFGDSSDAEMCFGGMYRYPAANSNLFCPF